MLYTGIKNRKIIYIRSQIIILARLLDFGTIPTMWYFSFFILLHVNVIISVLMFQGRELCSQLYVKWIFVQIVTELVNTTHTL